MASLTALHYWQFSTRQPMFVQLLMQSYFQGQAMMTTGLLCVVCPGMRLLRQQNNEGQWLWRNCFQLMPSSSYVALKMILLSYLPLSLWITHACAPPAWNCSPNCTLPSLRMTAVTSSTSVISEGVNPMARMASYIKEVPGKSMNLRKSTTHLSLCIQVKLYVHNSTEIGSKVKRYFQGMPKGPMERTHLDCSAV